MKKWEQLAEKDAKQKLQKLTAQSQAQMQALRERIRRGIKNLQRLETATWRASTARAATS